MENNNFYVGKIFHRRKFKFSFIESCILYTEDNFHYLDLINEKIYTTDTREKDYVIKDSLKYTDINDYVTDYNYLLDRYRHKSGKKIKVLENK